MAVGHGWPHILSEYGNSEQVKSSLLKGRVSCFGFCFSSPLHYLIVLTQICFSDTLDFI